ncbi:MAG: tRNA (N(6)-L-threonylcarbamoyladenosine(37)-C(2))-methylthiotransferase MtaB [Bacteroidota bacterium]
MKNVALHTLGCKVNYTETSTIGRQFIQQGYQIVDTDQPCDIYVLNTCSVTERADKECRQIIRRVLRHSPNAYVVVIGCYAQLQASEIASIAGVDLVLGAKNKFNIFEFAGDFVKHQQTQIHVSCIEEPLEFIPSYSGDVEGRTRAFLKIQDGCDYNCSFCTIPLARGESRSLPVDQLVRQGHMLCEQGFREIVLTGVNLGDYGRKFNQGLLDLLKVLEQLPVDRLRISSIEPNLLIDDIINFVLSSEKFCPHFHIPLQSGSDSILKIMRRRYLSNDYRNLVESIKKMSPDACIGADVLVGFPGETDAVFNESYSFLKDIPVSYLHVFTYSERENTPAIDYPNEVEMHVRHERNEILRLLSDEKRKVFSSRYLDKSLPFLFENTIGSNLYSGLSANYIRINAHSDQSLTNEIHDVTITGYANGVCSGEIISPCSINHRYGELILT